MKQKLFCTLMLLLCVGTLVAQNLPQKDVSLFKDNRLTALKSGISAADIEKMESPALKAVAGEMLSGRYTSAERLKSYECYLAPQVLARQLKTSLYSQYENPTGIYFDDKDTAIIWVGDTKGVAIQLLVNYWGESKEYIWENIYQLDEGYNVIPIESKGNSYIRYYSKSEPSNHKIDVHILTGKVNGVFNIATDDNKRWNKLLDNAVSPVMDIVGKQTQLIYSISSLKKEAYGKGVELVNLYDSLITQQHRLMGLVKYNRVPKNHMLGRVIWNGFMHADELGAAFHDNTMEYLANPDRLRTNSWGVAHEFGHVNQVRPVMCWAGTTEVTNNIYSVWAQYTYNKDMPKLEREKVRDYDGDKLGGRITAYMESAFVHHQPWLTQAGNDRWKRKSARDWGGDHFVKLVPFWQLQLYFVVAGDGQKWEQKDFYGDIFIQAIDEKGTEDKPDSFYQLAFIKRACDVAKLDLTDFFEQSGMLIPVDLWVDDYTCAQMTITEKDIKEVKTYASKYAKPVTPVLHYLTANSVEAYKKMLPLEGAKGKGFVQEDKKIVVNNDAWKNAVAFESYAGDRLVKVAFVGAGSIDASTTTVHMPQGTTSVKAVGSDGTRKEVI